MADRTTLEELAGISYGSTPTAEQLEYDESLSLNLSIETAYSVSQRSGRQTGGDMTTLHVGAMPHLARGEWLSISTPQAILDVSEWA